MQLMKEEDLFCKRLVELSQVSYHKGICTFSEFLNLNEINLFYNIKAQLSPVQTNLYGGYTDGERKIICFYNEDLYPRPDFPIDCIHIKPIHCKFSDDLTHRDFLGALTHLGLDRSKLGDILIVNNESYLFCNHRISQFIVDNLCMIKHTNVTCEIVDFKNTNYTPKYIAISGTVPSLRLDAILTVAFKTSRSSLSSLIAGGKVYVNSKLILSNSYILKEGDIISVRGYGKFIYKETNNQTKKGRFYITLLKYA